MTADGMRDWRSGALRRAGRTGRRLALVWALALAPAAALGADLSTPLEPGAVARIDEDAWLKERIARRLAWDAELAPYGIGVAVNGAVVNLTGSVGTQPESRRARRIAEDELDIVGVVNGIYVDPGLEPVAHVPVERPDDATLQDRIGKVLAEDPAIRADAIAIDVRNGHVVLSGPVPEIAQRIKAERIVSLLAGVQSLKNDLRLEESPGT